jgi:hypothetical protein
MALVHAIFVLVVVLAFYVAATGIGNLILRALKMSLDTDLQHLLVSTALGIVSVEVALFGVELTQHIRTGCHVIAGLLAFFPLPGFKANAERGIRAWNARLPKNRVETALLLIIALVLAFEFLASQAPLTGSDALNYHFTAQKLILKNGFHPAFSIATSFFCGQQHLLILFGLALGGEQLAMGFIFLGGVLAACSLTCLAILWCSTETALLFTALFLLTPVVFWQISTSGAPDIWMAYFAVAAVIVLCQGNARGTWQHALVAGFLAGGIAGGKYIGCVVAMTVAVAIIVEQRSAWKILLFGAGSLATGAWPYLRNFVWTGDPAFPFLFKLLVPRNVNSFALTSLQANTSAPHSANLLQMLPFVFFSGINTNFIGLWDFFGPLIFALSPLLLLATSRLRRWRVVLLVWTLSAAGIFLTSGLSRFLLPVFPIGLACIAAALAASETKNWRITRTVALSLTILLGLFGAGGLAVYGATGVETALGFISQSQYLEEKRPEYQEAQKINQALRDHVDEGNALVFIRHLYSLDIPYINGDPGTSWLVDPDHLQTAQQWQTFFREQKIAFVVRSPEYPAAIQPVLRQMEATGQLIPMSRSDVQDFQGMRIQGKRVDVPVVILRVR